MYFLGSLNLISVKQISQTLFTLIQIWLSQLPCHDTQTTSDVLTMFTLLEDINLQFTSYSCIYSSVLLSRTCCYTRSPPCLRSPAPAGLSTLRRRQWSNLVCKWKHSWEHWWKQFIWPLWSLCFEWRRFLQWDMSFIGHDKSQYPEWWPAGWRWRRKRM